MKVIEIIGRRVMKKRPTIASIKQLPRIPKPLYPHKYPDPRSF
jgi:hypothetical protein